MGTYSFLGFELGIYGNKIWGFPLDIIQVFGTNFWLCSSTIFQGRDGYNKVGFCVFSILDYITTFRVVGTATYDGAEKVREGAVMWCQTGNGKKIQQNWCSYHGRWNGNWKDGKITCKKKLSCIRHWNRYWRCSSYYYNECQAYRRMTSVTCSEITDKN